jgi:hypothetical protein
MNSDYTSRMRPLLAGIVLWLVALSARWLAVDAAVVGSDSLGPYLQACSLSASWLPKPPNPESGDALWISALPLVWLADSIRSLFQLRMALGALVAPAAFAATWWFLPHDTTRLRRWTATVSAGLLVATDPGLIDTLISGARSYGAPELVGLATAALALAWRGKRLGAACAAAFLVMATGHHPLAAGFLLAAVGLVVASPSFRRHLGRRGVRTAVVVGLIFTLPRLARTTAIALCGEGAPACLSKIATSNVGENETLLPVLTRALHDRFAVDLGWGWVLIAIGVGISLFGRRERRAGLWAIGGLLGILLIGASTGYVRAYHLRIAAVPLAVATAIGLSRWWPVCLIAITSLAIRGHLNPPAVTDPGAVARADLIASKLVDIEGTIWVDQLWWDGPPKVDAPAVVLSAVLADQDPDRFQTAPDATFVLLVSGSGPPPPGTMLAKGEGWVAVQVGEVRAAQMWLKGITKRPHQKGSAYDWMAALHPLKADMKRAHW